MSYSCRFHKAYYTCRDVVVFATIAFIELTWVSGNVPTDHVLKDLASHRWESWRREASRLHVAQSVCCVLCCTVWVGWALIPPWALSAVQLASPRTEQVCASSRLSAPKTIALYTTHTNTDITLRRAVSTHCFSRTRPGAHVSHNSQPKITKGTFWL